jgi:hypothetical protein
MEQPQTALQFEESEIEISFDKGIDVVFDDISW